MQNIVQKKEKGSTLLLAMVIISTVFFAGVGVITILLRQIREMPAIESEAAAFYISETFADMIRQQGIQNASCNNLNFGNMTVECSAQLINQQYHIRIGVNNHFYQFVVSSGEGAGNGDVVRVYFQTPTFPNPQIEYTLGSGGTVYKDAIISAYAGWVVGTIMKTELSDEWVDIHICPQKSRIGCQHPTGWRQIANIKTPICRLSCTSYDCNIPCVNPGTVLAYFRKPTGWGSVITSTYDVWSVGLQSKIMSESSYSGWMWSSVTTNNSYTQVRFCQGQNPCPTGQNVRHFPAEWMRWGIICVDGTTTPWSSHRCFHPNNNY